MAFADRHPLTNYSLARKLAATAALVLGFGLFLAGWLVSVELVGWELSLGVFLDWGHGLRHVRAAHPEIFWFLCAVHLVSVVLIGAVAGTLLQRVAFSRRARKAVLGAIVIFGLLDLAVWLTISSWARAADLLGGVVLVLVLLLAYASLHPLAQMWIYRRWGGTGGAPVRVVIVGGGFAGLYAALHLDRRLGYHRDLQITLIDRRNYFLFPPLLPSVAAGAIETRQVTYPFRRIFEATNVVFKKELVDRIDTERKVIHARVDVDDDPVTGAPTVICRETAYDYLILAPGSDTNTFNTPGAREHAFFMRELGDAIAVRNQVIDCFERAAREDDVARRCEQLTFVIVGAGPTGVELAAEVHDLIAHILLGRYPEVERQDVRVVVVQSTDQILPGWHASIVASADAHLRKMKVELLLKRKVVKVTPFCVELDGGDKIPTRTCVWCAGVKPSPLLSACSLPLHKSGRVEIEPDLRVRGKEDVFVLGDAAFLINQGNPLPPLGQVAFQQGQHAAANVEELLRRRPTRPFRYFNYGALVAVGEHFAAIDLMGIRMSGFFAWWIWRTLYLGKLVGFGNKIRVVLDWTLDLLIERSISQIAAERHNFFSAEVAAPPAEPAKDPGKPAAS